MSALAQPLLTVRTHHKFRKIRSFFAKKCRRPHLKNPLCPQNVHTGETPPLLTADILYGLLLTNVKAGGIRCIKILCIINKTGIWSQSPQPPEANGGLGGGAADAAAIL